MNLDNGILGLVLDKAQAFICLLIGHEWSKVDRDGFRFCICCRKVDV
jgi:hypothetical protein